MQIRCDIKASKGTSGSGHMKSKTIDWGLGVGFEEDRLASARKDDGTPKSVSVWIRPADFRGCSTCSCSDPMTAKGQWDPRDGWEKGMKHCPQLPPQKRTPENIGGEASEWLIWNKKGCLRLQPLWASWRTCLCLGTWLHGVGELPASQSSYCLNGFI